MLTPSPIILHHGFMDVFNLRIGTRGFYSFQGLHHSLASTGNTPIQTRVHPTASIQRRATQLRQQILQIMRNYPPDSRALILAHSMGGLDARYMITHLDMADKISGLLTISTPHQGTTYADYALRNMTRLGVSRFFKLLNLDFTAVEDLTLASCQRFNESTTNHPAVRYFSISAACQSSDLPPWSRRAHRIIFKNEGPNDGLVSIRSATFGEHLATWPTTHWKLLTKDLRPSRSDAIVQQYQSCLQTIFSSASAGPH
jgi:triacylglycerol lipase